MCAEQRALVTSSSSSPAPAPTVRHLDDFPFPFPAVGTRDGEGSQCCCACRSAGRWDCDLGRAPDEAAFLTLESARLEDGEPEVEGDA